jgi:hypothetical protein
MQIRRTLTAALVGTAVVAAAPAAATAGPGRSTDSPNGHHGRGGGQQAGQSFDRSDVPSRVSTRLKRAERALDRASDAIDDSGSGASALKSVRTNLAAAVKAAKKRAASDNGPDSFYAVASTQHNVVDEVVSLYDGTDDTTGAALTETLNAAIDGRDDLVASIPSGSQSDYSFVADQIASDAGDEIDAIDEALGDDTLTADEQSALTAARAKLVATQSAAQALAGSSSQTAADDSSSGDGSRDGDCPRGERGGRNGSDGSSSGSSTSEVPQT